MILCARDERGKDTFVEVTPKNITIPIYYKKTKCYINAEWYTFEPFRPCDDITYLKPFFYFFNGSFAVFGNDIDELTYDGLGSYSQMLFSCYLESMLKMHYKGDFDQYFIMKTTDKDDDDTTYIHWKLGKKFSYKWEDGGKHLTFTIDGTESRCKVFVRWLKKIMDMRFHQWINMAARRMKLLDKIKWCKFEDCTSIKWVDETTKQNVFEFCKIGVDGTNYHENEFSSYETDTDHEDDKKSTVKYTPFAYLMDAKQQKILLVHELVHTKIGYAHQHDKYFWYLLEYYGGYSRTDDSSYTPQIEARDTKQYDSNTTKYTCDELIAKHKQWIRSGMKGQW